MKQVVDDSGNIVEESHYKGGIRHGNRTLWHSDGVKLGECKYFNGKPHGKCLLWNTKSQKTLEAYYENGERVGKYYWYSEDGVLLSEYDYST